MAKKNFLLNLFLGPLEKYGESELEIILQDFHDSDKEGYLGAVHSIHRGVILLMPHVLKSKSKIDDAIVGTIDDAIVQSAKDNGVSLDGTI